MTTKLTDAEAAVVARMKAKRKAKTTPVESTFYADDEPAGLPVWNAPGQVAESRSPGAQGTAQRPVEATNGTDTHQGTANVSQAAHDAASGTERHQGRRLVGTKASAVRMERTTWLVDCWLPEHSLTLLAGREGIGKSTIATKWAADATTGALTGTPMNVAYVITEDIPSRTVVPRLTAAGADLDRVDFIDADIPDPDDPDTRYQGTMTLPGDIRLLQEFIETNNIGLLILDAAKSVMDSKLDSNSDVDTRRLLEPLTRVARDAHCTIIGLAHFGKRDSADTGKLLLGSAAWSQVARSVLAVAPDPDSATLKVWNSKKNLAPRTRTVEATIQTVTVDIDGNPSEVGRIVWGAECDEDGSALLAPSDEREAADDRTAAQVWLQDFLKGCERPKKEVIDAARKDGLNQRTVERAFQRLGGAPRYDGFPRLAYWSLPVSEQPPGV